MQRAGRAQHGVQRVGRVPSARGARRFRGPPTTAASRGTCAERTFSRHSTALKWREFGRKKSADAARAVGIAPRAWGQSSSLVHFEDLDPIVQSG